jgi:hypothetical protein
MTMKLDLIHLCDSQSVVNLTNGKWFSGDQAFYADHVKSLRWGMYAFQYQWKFSPGTVEGDMLVHRLRGLNSLAEFYANHVLDTFEDCVEGMVPFAVIPGCLIVVCSDGASRNNPGDASAAAVVQVVQNNQLYVVAFKAVRLGKATSMCAEFEAACLGQALLVQWCCKFGICSWGGCLSLGLDLVA